MTELQAFTEAESIIKQYKDSYTLVGILAGYIYRESKLQTKLEITVSEVAE